MAEVSQRWHGNILVILEIFYLHSSGSVAIEMNTSTFFPNFTQMGTLMVTVAFILNYMGVEASAIHVNEMRNLGRDYPLAMLLMMIAAIAVSSIGCLAISAVITHEQINLYAGVMQIFIVLINHLGAGYEWAVRVIAALLLLAVLAEIAAWIVGPSRGMLVTAQQGILPARFARMNKNEVPMVRVKSQLAITSIALNVLTNTGAGNNLSFLVAPALTVVIYLCSYFTLFLGYIQLVRK